MSLAPLALALALLAAPAHAGPYQDGVAAARAGDPEAAAGAYRKALAAGDIDPAVYHGLGNALYRQGQAGAALAAWRRGQRLSPRDGDLAANIDRVRAKTADRVDPPAAGGGPFFWLRLLSLAESAWLAGILGMLGGGGLVVRELRRRQGGRGRAWGAETVLGLGGVLLLGGATAVAAHGTETAVVSAERVAAQSALGPDGIELFVLHEGAEIAVAEHAGAHVLVALPDGRKGWLPATAMISTHPSAPFPPR